MKNKRNVVNWILLIGWMSGIFIMSNQPSSISDSQSGEIIKGLTSIGINMNGIFGKFANFAVRKSAHFLEYMILALLTFNVLEKNFEIKQVNLITIIIVFIYASSDEIHQLFVLGREGAIRDVIIDTCGGITLLLLKKFNNYKNS